MFVLEMHNWMNGDEHLINKIFYEERLQYLALISVVLAKSIMCVVSKFCITSIQPNSCQCWGWNLWSSDKQDLEGIFVSRTRWNVCVLLGVSLFIEQLSQNNFLILQDSTLWCAVDSPLHDVHFLSLFLYCCQFCRNKDVH